MSRETNTSVEYKELVLSREAEAGLAFLSSEEYPDLFVATKEGEELRLAVDKAIKNLFSDAGKRVQVYTNGKIDGPRIDVLVKLT